MTQPTKKQEDARERNWQIFRLRGLWHNLPLRDPVRLETIRSLIDQELKDMGAEPNSSRRQRIREFYRDPKTWEMSVEEHEKARKQVFKPFGGKP